MFYRLTKRLFDIAAAGLGLVILLPLGLLIGLFVKLSDRGPIFYRQTRIGQFGKPFRIWKFRSMVVNADKMGVPLTGREDCRITPLGRLLRRTKLDELPQLWNVFKGDMSFVGPRPEVPRYVERYTLEQREILQFKPGITDAASVMFRNEEILLSGARDVEDFYLRYCVPKKLELNRQYAEHATLFQDIWIILQTICPYWLGVLTFYFISLVFSLWFSYELRSDFGMSRHDYAEFWHFLPWIVFPQLILLVWRVHLHGMLSYFSIPEMRRTFIALGMALGVQAGLLCFVHSRPPPASNIMLMDFILSFLTLCAVRMAFRLLRENASQTPPKYPVPARQVAIIGTGALATNLALDFARSVDPARRVVAFFDDDPRTWHKRPHNIPVVGMPECLLNREWFQQIDEVIVTLPEAEATRIQQITDMLNGLPLKVTIASGWPALRAL